MNNEDWNRRYREKELVWSAGPNQFLVPEVEGLPPGRALDLACGEGRNALWLAQNGWSVVATDYSDVAIEKARARSAELGVEVDFRVADACEPPPVPGPYDLVILFYLQLPWPQMKIVLGHAQTAVAPGGTMLVVGHDRSNLDDGVGGPQSAEVLYRPKDVADHLTELEIERAETVKRAVTVDGEERHALDVLVRACKTR